MRRADTDIEKSGRYRKRFDMARNHEIDEQFGRQLDDAYREYVAARAITIGALRRLMQATAKLATLISIIRGDIRWPFVRWCNTYSKVFDPRVARTVCAVANRAHSKVSVETWQLRLLGVVETVHHAHRQRALKRRHKGTSWLSYISRAQEEVHKIIERAGGAQNIPISQRAAINRQLQSFDGIRKKLQ